MADKSNSVGGRGYRVWTTSEEKNLIEGVTAMGVGNWEAIRMNKKFSLSQRSALQLKDKWRNLVKYKHVSTDDFPADVAVSNRRRSTSTMAALHKITGKRSLSSSPLSSPTLTPKKAKMSCSPSPSPASSASSYQHADFGSTGLHRVESVSSLPGKAIKTADISDLDRALHMVHRGKNMMETAVQIQTEANQLLSSALEEMAICASDPATMKRVESAHKIASMSNVKAERCKGFLESAMKQLQEVQRPFSEFSPSSTNERQSSTGIEGTDDSQSCSVSFETDCSYFMSNQVSQTVDLNREDEDLERYGLPAMDYFNLLGDLGNELYDELV